MKTTDKIDAARIDLLLGELRLPGIKLTWAALAETADKEGWPAARFLAALAEQEMVERSRRRFGRHLEEARLPPGKTLDAFDFDAVPMISKAQIQALVLQRERVVLHSRMRDEAVCSGHLIPCPDIAAEIHRLVTAAGGAARIAALPQGPLTIPYLKPAPGT